MAEPQTNEQLSAQGLSAQGLSAGLLLNLLAAELAESVREGDDESVPGYYPRLSGVGRCPRTYYWAAMGVEADFTTGAEGVIEMGTLWHRLIQAMLQKLGFVTELEVKLTVDDVDVIGHVDAYAPATGTIVEIKTVSRFGKALLPIREHVLQAAAYFYAQPNEPKDWQRVNFVWAPKEVWLIYFFREDPHPEQAVHFTYDAASLKPLRKVVEAKLRTILKAYNDKFDPGIPENYNRNSFPCRWKTRYGLDAYCPFYKLCYGDNETETTSANVTYDIDPSLTDTLFVLYEQRNELQRQLQIVDSAFRDVFARITASFTDTEPKHFTSKEFGDYVIVYRETKTIDVDELKRRYPDIQIPYKTAKFWQMRRTNMRSTKESKEGDGHATE